MISYIFQGQSIYINKHVNIILKNIKLLKYEIFIIKDLININIINEIKNKNYSLINIQLIIILSNIIKTIYIKKKIENVKAVSGHSLGEISALIYLKSLSFINAIKIIIMRTNISNNEIRNNNYINLIIYGIDCKKLIKHLIEKFKYIYIVSYNSDIQITILINNIYNKEIKKIIKNNKMKCKIFYLLYPHIFHTSIMKIHKKKIFKFINKIKFYKPICKIYQNYSASSSINPKEIKINFIKSMYNTVLWKNIIKKMIYDKINIFYHIGPYKYTYNISKLINKKIKNKIV